MANTQFNVHEPSVDITDSIVSGTVNFTFTAKTGYRQGNHVHAEVYGTYAIDSSQANSIPFFRIIGVKTPSADRKAGTAILMSNAGAPLLVCPGLAWQMSSNGYFTQKLTGSITSGQRFGFIIDFIDD